MSPPCTDNPEEGHLRPSPQRRAIIRPRHRVNDRGLALAKSHVGPDHNERLIPVVRGHNRKEVSVSD